MKRVARAAVRLFAIAFALSIGVGQAPADERQWRAFWVDAWNSGIKTPEQVDRLIADMKALHCNTIIAQVRKSGDAYFRKTVDPFADDPVIPAGFDPLADLLEKAHKEGMQVHAWLNAMPMWKGSQTPPRSKEHLYHFHGPERTGRANWLTCDDKGDNRYPVGFFLDAGHPNVSTHLAKVVVDLVKNYPVDGVHLDYIRYPESTGEEQGGIGYNAVSVERFNQVHGRSGKPGRDDPAWKDWRRQQVTQLVRCLRVELLAANPKVLFSAALIPWGDGPSEEIGWVKSAPYNRVFQDWHAWRQEGLLDLAIPMNYDREARPDQKAFFEHWVTIEKEHRYHSQLVVGLGAYLNSTADTLKQLRLALAPSAHAGPADGVCIFSYAAFRNAAPGSGKPTLEDLRHVLLDGDGNQRGPFAQPAALPEAPRVVRPKLGTLAGYVLGGGGKPVDSRAVRIEDDATGKLVATSKTDGNGFFAALFLPPGKYRVSVPGDPCAAPFEVRAGAVTNIVKPVRGSEN
jgi:uncharacterized lipoprotein YddW (UPF0748 family)